MFKRGQAATAPATVPQRIAFYTRRDQLAGALAALLAFLGYWITLAPSVTLEDSGEFITAAYHLGVPHPPGYPAWTILAFLWQKLIPFGNIAWRVNLFSAFTSALAVGLVALLVSRSSQVMLVRLGLWQRLASQRAGDLLVLAAAVSAGLMLAFSAGLWSQAVVAKVHGMSALFLLLVLAGLYRWSFETESRWRLYGVGFVWGVGLTVHQTLVLLVVAMAMYVWFTDKSLGRDLLSAVLLVIAGTILKLALTPGSLLYQGLFPLVVLLGVGAMAGWGAYRLLRRGEGLGRCWRQMLWLLFAAVAGLAFYLYEPIASASNPPMNWGYTRLWDGFVHHLSRGQYENLQTGRDLLQFWGQVNLFLHDLQWEFGIAFVLLGLIPWLFYTELTGTSRDWMRFLMVAFLSLVLGFLFFSNPSLEKQKQLMERVFFTSSHCLYALWIGYGLSLGSVFLCTRKPSFARATVPLVIAMAVLPVISFARHWEDCNQRGHDFGYRLGYLMFKPAGGYQPMEHGAVLFGGTDPGRFVASYMVFVESQEGRNTRTQAGCCPEGDEFDRRDVHLLTQNALADPSYMRSVRDQYGVGRPSADDPGSLASRPGWQNMVFWNMWHLLGRDKVYPRTTLWLPSAEDSARVVQEYLEQLRRRSLLPGEMVNVEGDRVRVSGLTAVKALNGELARLIFERNKDQHAFYVEESYVLPWMYDFAQPYGIIFRLSNEPLPEFTVGTLMQDRAYWAELSRQLLEDRRYRRDQLAQRTFAKLRANIGSLYAHRGIISEAEHAFRQALQLCPTSAEASYRLAQMYAGVGRTEEALKVLEAYQKHDPFNATMQEAINQIRQNRQPPTVP